MNALIAALCTVLACQIRGNETVSAIFHPANLAANMRLYKETLGALELAAIQANDAELISKIDVCRHLHAQVKEHDY
jgi:hypothetical protein